VEERFLGPAALAELLAATRLNVHPPSYDAYGMTIVEAASQARRPPPPLLAVAAVAARCLHPILPPAATARLKLPLSCSPAPAQGAPSLVHPGGAVGAVDLLRPECGEVFTADMGAESGSVAALAAEVERLLRDPSGLRRVAAAASARARSWSEEANASALMELVEGLLPPVEPPAEPTAEAVEPATAAAPAAAAGRAPPGRGRGGVRR